MIHQLTAAGRTLVAVLLNCHSEQLRPLISPALDALRSCVGLLRRFSGRYVCGLRSGDVMEEFCRSTSLVLLLVIRTGSNFQKLCVSSLSQSPKSLWKPTHKISSTEEAGPLGSDPSVKRHLPSHTRPLPMKVPQPTMVALKLSPPQTPTLIFLVAQTLNPPFKRLPSPQVYPTLRQPLLSVTDAR